MVFESAQNEDEYPSIELKGRTSHLKTFYVILINYIKMLTEYFHSDMI
jgi:hypothetical protein